MSEKGKRTDMTTETIEKSIKDVHKKSQEFQTQDNPELSLLGSRWYYISQLDSHSLLNYDEIVDVNEDGVFITVNLDTDGTGAQDFLNYPFYLTKEQYKENYPISPDFPYAISANGEVLFNTEDQILN